MNRPTRFAALLLALFTALFCLTGCGGPKEGQVKVKADGARRYTARVSDGRDAFEQYHDIIEFGTVREVKRNRRVKITFGGDVPDQTAVLTTIHVGGNGWRKFGESFDRVEEVEIKDGKLTITAKLPTSSKITTALGSDEAALLAMHLEYFDGENPQTLDLVVRIRLVQ